MTATQNIPPSAEPSAEIDVEIAQAPAVVRKTLDIFGRVGLPYTFRHVEATSANVDELAVALGCETHDLALTTIFRGKATRKPFLLIHAASSAVSDKILSQIVGENIQRAEADLVMRFSGFQLDAVAPLGHLNRLPIIMDSSLTRFARVWINLGAPGCYASVPTLVLARTISARIVRLVA
ncbi:MAG: hypothetical protein LCH39_03510 [Proteobacteria bacterium]|nr:hypothetical protein [Pseudomonadota bacterium]